MTTPSPEPTWALTLNRYQRDNLRQALCLIATDPALAPMNTGDWVREIFWLLGNHVNRDGERPNVPDAYIQAGLAQAKT